MENDIRFRIYSIVRFASFETLQLKARKCVDVSSCLAANLRITLRYISKDSVIRSLLSLLTFLQIVFLAHTRPGWVRNTD